PSWPAGWRFRPSPRPWTTPSPATVCDRCAAWRTRWTPPTRAAVWRRPTWPRRARGLRIVLTMKVLAFVVLLGVLIFVHELGHFLVAKAFRIKVLRFSLGFGPRILGFRRGETDYRISLLPLGGYVKMAGDDPSEQLAPEDRGR